MPSPSRRRGARYLCSRKKTTVTVATEDESPNKWADMPLDWILAVFHKLDHIDILMGADQVCRSWRRAARDEPELWRRIVMRGNADLSFRLNRQGMACAAVRRSAGQCEAFCGEYAGDDGFLLYLSEQAPSLKSLRLVESYGVDTEIFAEAIKKFPLLEELELSRCNIRHVWHVIQFCPQLKHFRHVKKGYHIRDNYYDTRRGTHNMEASAIARMPGLLSLQLLGDHLDNEGLSAILDNCPHLELLDLRGCLNIRMDGSLRLNCVWVNWEKLCRYTLTDDRVHFCVDQLALSYDKSTDDYEDFQQWQTY
ncbi:putative F-box/LRR-repeat protein 23 [Lolium rigidum]|uniref:putative F-box/LRR-repeat protein 23 n=1 Tax=Lolium rigidum TaxID=89674 RepID=UPI001F5C5697|nr:putative F-box/LRR-repeat protein 23 [Lolium rigidum]